MYQIIAGEYDDLFPHSSAKTEFVESLLTNGDKRILDLGCATGELLLSLAKPDRELTGIDLDGDMVETARKKGESREIAGVTFTLYDMRFYLEYIEIHSYDVILCFGNTLAYLENGEELLSFFKNAYRVLRPGGRMIIQIINFDNPAMDENFRFPELNTPRIRFTRSYGKDPAGGLLFNTEIYQKESGITLNDTHRLYPFRSNDLERTAREALFREVMAWGGYRHEEPEESDFFRLFQITK